MCKLSQDIYLLFISLNFRTYFGIFDTPTTLQNGPCLEMFRHGWPILHSHFASNIIHKTYEYIIEGEPIPHKSRLVANTEKFIGQKPNNTLFNMRNKVRALLISSASITRKEEVEKKVLTQLLTLRTLYYLYANIFMKLFLTALSGDCHS